VVLFFLIFKGRLLLLIAVYCVFVTIKSAWSSFTVCCKSKNQIFIILV